MRISIIKELIDRNSFDDALGELEQILKEDPECPYLWNLRGDLIQLASHKVERPLSEAGRSYQRALELNRDDLEALEGLAHFYDAVECNPNEAKRYALAYLEKVKKAVKEMEQIASESVSA